MSNRLLRAAIVAFLVSRGIVFLTLLVLSQIAFLQKVYSHSVWETRIVLQSARVRPELTRMIMAGDAWWYRRIAAHGYADAVRDPAQASKVAFFPLYPLLVRACGTSGDFALDGTLVSNASLFLALVILGPLATRRSSDPGGDGRAVRVVPRLFALRVDFTMA